MPQKRNPYALAVLRGGAGTLLGRLTGLLATGLTPSARTDNWLYAYGEVAGALDMAGRLARLGTAVAAGLYADTGRMQEDAARHFTTAADMAEELAVQCGMDYRTAYRVVGRAVAQALASGETSLTAPLLEDAAKEVTGQTVPIKAARVTEATDPLTAVNARNAPGGASPARVSEHAARVARRAGIALRWNQETRTRMARAEAGLVASARRLATAST
jgi:argininosuccinate lyase